jgi:hypothetical protein
MRKKKQDQHGREAFKERRVVCRTIKKINTSVGTWYWSSGFILESIYELVG